MPAKTGGIEGGMAGRYCAERIIPGLHEKDLQRGLSRSSKLATGCPLDIPCSRTLPRWYARVDDLGTLPWPRAEVVQHLVRCSSVKASGTG